MNVIIFHGLGISYLENKYQYSYTQLEPLYWKRQKTTHFNASFRYDLIRVNSYKEILVIMENYNK